MFHIEFLRRWYTLRWYLVITICIILIVTAIQLTSISLTFWIKVGLTISASLLAIIDIHHTYKKNDKLLFNSRRSSVIVILLGWLILTVWDNFNEEVQSIEQLERAEKADSLSEIIAKRTTNILADIDKSINEIKKTTNSIEGVDSLLNEVNDTLISQVDILNEAVIKSQELVGLEQKKLALGKAEVTIISGNVDFVPNAFDSTKLAVKFKLRNLKERTATNIRHKSILVVFDSDGTRTNFFLSNLSNWSEELELLGKGNFELDIESFFDLEKDDFIQNYGYAVWINRVRFKDELDKKQRDLNKFFTCSFANNNSLTFHETTSREQKVYVTNYLIRMKQVEYLTKETLSLYQTSF